MGLQLRKQISLLGQMWSGIVGDLHPQKTGKKYRVLDIIDIKVNDEWKEAVLYEPSPDYGAEKRGKPKKFARLKEDFWEKFE
jgi:hypothetical protein